MSVKTSKLKVGDVLYNMYTERAGNTTARRDVVREVKIVTVAEDGSWAEIDERVYGRVKRQRYHRTMPFRRSPKEWISPGWGVRYCYVCRKEEDEGHSPTCTHPRVVRTRKKAEKGAEVKP